MDLWEKATALHTSQQYEQAELLYDQLLTQNHDNAGLMATMGTLYLQTQRYGLAIHFLEAAIKKGLRQADVLSNIGLAYKYVGQNDKAIKLLKESIAVNPTGETLANYSALLIESGQDEKCRSICKRAIELSPEHPIAHWNLSLSMLADGQFEQGWDEYEWGLVNGSMRVNRNIGNVPEWDGKSKGKICVYGEQGIGDEIMFASMLPDLLKDNEVVIESHKRLKTLFENSFPDVKVYGTREEQYPTWPAEEHFDYRMSIGSLGKLYRRSQDSFPGNAYLKSDAIPKGDKFRVGISWTGGLKSGRVLKRSVPLSWWKSILNVPNVEFVSLQYTNGKEELDLMKTLGYNITVMDDYIKAEDYAETAKVVQSCDLVISVCTSVIHLAGALGVPCWVLTPKNPAWRYQNKGRMPWYRSVRLYRQPETTQDSWVSVIQQVGADLDELVSSKNRIAA